VYFNESEHEEVDWVKHAQGILIRSSGLGNEPSISTKIIARNEVSGRRRESIYESGRASPHVLNLGTR
jgi:hypothetical protein